jgi:hypothetical protein
MDMWFLINDIVMNLGHGRKKQGFWGSEITPKTPEKPNGQLKQVGVRMCRP